MASEETPQIEKPLTVREKMTIHLIICLIKLLKPFNYTHVIEHTLEDFMNELKKA